MNVNEIINKLKKLSNPKAVEGMAKFGINIETALAVSMPEIRKLAKEIGKNHKLALGLWKTNIHEARILACLIADYKLTDKFLMEDWVKDFNSWDICDQVCGNLFDKTEIAHKKAIEWSKRKEEFVKRAGFVLMATLSVHDKKTNDEVFERFFSRIVKESDDERNFVKKAVNWALRQIGKRNLNLNKKAIKIGEEILKKNSKSSKWIAGDALRELKSETVQKRLKSKI